MWKRLNSNQMCEQCSYRGFSYKEVSYREVLLYIYILSETLFLRLYIFVTNKSLKLINAGHAH